MADQKKQYPTMCLASFSSTRRASIATLAGNWRARRLRDQGQYSSVFHQPSDESERRAATRALLCCPTGSIGTRGQNLSKDVMNDLPLQLAPDVFYCGFNSEDSFGANSFFIKHPDGNWLIDSPKYVSHLVKRFQEFGGIKYIFLTHRDDVADADQFATKFGAQRIIHKRDLDAMPGAEIVIDETEAHEFQPGFTIIPVPGHTRGHMVLLHKTFLFTGDHLAFDPETSKLEAFRRACWYSWPEQTKSMAKLLNYSFDWVLAGHGDRVHLPPGEMHAQLEQLVEWMKDAS